MTGDVGALGFWLMVGMIGAASTVTGGLKARDKERERQATLRALIGKDEKTVTEVLAYMREQDAAEAAVKAAANASPETRRTLKAILMGALAFVGVVVAGYVAGLALHFGVFHGSDSDFISLFTVFGICVAGLIIISWRVRRFLKQKNDAHPDA